MWSSRNLSLPLWSWAVLLFMCLACCPCNACIAGPLPRIRTTVPGIGFGLAADYGTATIYANRTFFNIAKIEGNTEYKHFMRTGGNAAAGQPQAPSALCSYLTNLPLVHHLCPKHLNVQAIESMLRALTASVEAYLGTGFCFVNIAVPHDKLVHDPSIELALNNLDLALQAPRLRRSATATVMATSRDCRFEELLLVIDYSHSGMTISLYSEDDGIFSMLHETVRQDLGANSTSSHPDRREEIRVAVENFLSKHIGRDVFRRFGLERVEVAGPDHIAALISYGDATNDADFRAALRDVLGDRLVDSKERMFDPFFVSAAGVAREAFKVMDYVFYDGPTPSWTCRWRSAFYMNPGERDL